MAVLIEAISVIIRREAIHSRYPEKWPGFIQQFANHTLCSDGEIVRVGFLKKEEAQSFIQQLEQRGLIFSNGKNQDITTLEPDFICPVDWLKCGKMKLGKNTISACWMTGSTSKRVIVPPNWRVEDSISQKPDAAYLSANENRFSLLIKTSLKTSATDKNKSAQNTESHDRLKNEFLPRALSLAENEGKHIAFSHFAVGIILRLLSRPAEAELRFRRANDLQPGILNTLQELVRCLGEQGRDEEALVFAREATAIAPHAADAWSNLAVALAHCGHDEEARRAIDKAVSFDPENMSIRDISENFDNYFGHRNRLLACNNRN